MVDKNGKEIRTGDVVYISGAFIKRQNGFFFVEYSPGDICWTGKYHALTKISKSGKISETKYRHSEWPLICLSNNRALVAEASQWNKEHAQIEVVDNVPRHEVRAFFADLARENREAGEYYKRCGNSSAGGFLDRADFCSQIADSILQ